MKHIFEVGDRLVAIKDVRLTGNEELLEGDTVVYEGTEGRAHLVRTDSRETHQVGGPTLGYEVQLELTDEELEEHFELA